MSNNNARKAFEQALADHRVAGSSGIKYRGLDQIGEDYQKAMLAWEKAAKALLKEFKSSPSEPDNGQREAAVEQATEVVKFVKKIKDDALIMGVALSASRHKQASGSLKAMEAELIEAAEAEGLLWKDRMTLEGRTLWFADGVGEVLVYETNNRGILFNYRGEEYKSVRDVMRAISAAV